MLCLGCYGRLPESRAQLPPGWKPYEPPPRAAPKPSSYARLWTHVFDTLKTLTDSEVFHTADGTGRMFAYCPVCKVGCLSLQIVDLTSGPVLRSPACDNGCTMDRVSRVLLKGWKR